MTRKGERAPSRAKTKRMRNCGRTSKKQEIDDAEYVIMCYRKRTREIPRNQPRHCFRHVERGVCDDETWLTNGGTRDCPLRSQQPTAKHIKPLFEERPICTAF
jgi:hypothetical protein